MKKRLIYWIPCFFLLLGCSSEEEQQTEVSPQDAVKEVVPIQTLFNEDVFPDSIHVALLKELRICDEFQKDTSNYLQPACSPRFFKLFPVSDAVPLKNAFMLQIKAMVGGVNLRRLVVFVREKGQLVKANTFIANLIGVQKQENGYDDLILRFNDNVDGDIIYYNTIFRWDGKRYQFLSAETIEGRDHEGPWRQRIKEEFKDSISKDILNTLKTNEMIL